MTWKHFLSDRFIIPLLGFSFLLLLMTACESSFQAPPLLSVAIEESEGGQDILEREFSKCPTGEEWLDDNTPIHPYNRPLQNGVSAQRQRDVESDFPHSYKSLDEMFPLRGSWRQSRQEVLDLVDRHVWSPELGRVVPLLHYFDMALLINVAHRADDAAANLSAQRMQILVREDSSNNLEDWSRIHTWPISSGIPCGKKITTFTGVFKFNPSRFHEKYASKLWDGVDMYESMFLYHRYQNGDSTGVAIHGTYLTENLGRRDSGGCVRVYRENSQCLFRTLTGQIDKPCLAGGHTNYFGRVPSFLPTQGEADPEYLSSGELEVNGYKVLVVLFNDENDQI